MHHVLRWLIGWSLLTLLVVPAWALAPALVVDRGPEGEARLSALPAALVIFDPAVGRCVRNSVVAAALVTVAALSLGLVLATVLERRRFWGRSILGFLVLTPLAVGPLWVVTGVVAVIGGNRPGTGSRRGRFWVSRGTNGHGGWRS